MKNKLLLLGFFFSAVSLFSQQNWDWGRYGGGPGNDIAYAIATDPNGFSYVTGRFTASITFGSLTVSSYGGPDIFVAKFDPNGNCIWLKHGGSLDAQDLYGDESHGIAIDSLGNCYVTGNFKGAATFGSLTIGSGSSRNIFVVKYDSNGNEIWAQCPVSSLYSHYSRAIATDNAGNSWITGYLGGGSTTFGSFTISGPGGYVVKYDPNGTVLMATKLGAGGAIDLYGIAVDNTGNSYTTGYLQTQETIGSQTFTSNGMRDAVLIKVDAGGTFSWLSQSWTLANSATWSNAVCCDPQNGIYICGHYDNTTIFGNDTLSIATSLGQELFLVKYDSNGNEIWAEQSAVIGNGFGYMSALAVTADGASNIFITGNFGEDLMLGTVQLNNNTGVNTFIAAYTSSGFCQYAVPSTGMNPGAYGQGISTDNYGGVYITGYAKAPVIFGSDTTQFIGGEDAFVARLGSHGKDAIQEYGNGNEVSLLPSGSQNWVLNFTESEIINPKMSFVLYDMTGRIVLQVPVTANHQQIGFGNLASGMYSWSVTDSQKRIGAGKIVIEN